jgi:hypothetical protein
MENKMSTEVATKEAENEVMSYEGGARGTLSMILDDGAMERIHKFANMMAGGKSTLPEHLRGNVADCAAVTMQAMQWRMNPFAVAQKTHLVKGTLGYEAQLVNAVITSLAPTQDRLHYEWFGNWEKILGKYKILKSDKGEYRSPGWGMADEEGLGVKVWATMKGEDEPRELTLLLVQALTRNSTLWADDPRQQLAYLGTKRWSRLYCPDVILGVYTPDELDEYQPRKEKSIGPVTAKDKAEAARETGSTDNPTVLASAELERIAKTGDEAALNNAWMDLGPIGRKAIGGARWSEIKNLMISAQVVSDVPAGEAVHGAAQND